MLTASTYSQNNDRITRTSVLPFWRETSTSTWRKRARDAVREQFAGVDDEPALPEVKRPLEHVAGELDYIEAVARFWRELAERLSPDSRLFAADDF